MITPRTPEKIHHDISDMLAKGVNYIDALVTYAEKNNLEIEAIADIVKKSSILKEKVRSDAIELRLVKNDDKGLIDFCE